MEALGRDCWNLDRGRLTVSLLAGVLVALVWFWLELLSHHAACATCLVYGLVLGAGAQCASSAQSSRASGPVLAAGLLLVHVMWSAGAWVDSAFHHRLLSAGLLTGVALGGLVLSAGLARVLARVATAWSWVVIAGLGVWLGLRVALGLTPAQAQAVLTPLSALVLGLVVAPRFQSYLP